MRRSVVALVLALVSSASAPAWGESNCPGLGEVLQINGPGLPVAIATNGELGITKDSLGITTWDLGQPTAPRRLGTLLGSRGWDPTIARADLYLHPGGFAVEVPTLGIYDLRHPAHPDRSWKIPTPQPNTVFTGYAGDDPWKGVAIRDEVIAAVHAETEIWILDLTQTPPSGWVTPAWSGLPARIVDVAFVGNRLVVLGWLGEVVVYDIVDPDAPTVVGTGSLGMPSLHWSLYGGGTLALAVETPFTSSGSIRSVVVVDLDDPAAPVAHDVTLDLGWLTIGRVELGGDGGVAQAYDPSGGGGWRLNELDFSDPSNPVVATFTPGGHQDIGLADGFVVRTRSWGIEVLERSAGFPLIGSSPLEGDANDLDVDGALGVVANGDAGLAVFDLTDPFAPVELSRIDVGGWADEVRITGTVAVALVTGQALVLVDLADPVYPLVSGTFLLTGSGTRTEHLAVDGDLAMVSFGSYGSESGFVIVDISDPSAPSVNSETVFSSPATNDTAAYLDGVVALTSNRNHLLTFDVSGAVPVLLDSIEVHPFNEIYSTAVVGDHAYAATAFRLDAVAVSDPSNLVLGATYESIQAARVGATGAGLVAVQTLSDGTLLGDFDDLGSPVLAAAPIELRWWETGTVMGEAWIRPSGPFLDIVSLECREPDAVFRWWGLGFRVSFENLSRYQVTSSSWDFGDGSGSTSSGYTVNHTYDQPGRYTVTLDVVGPGGTDTASMVIEVGTRIFFDDFETGDTIGWDGEEPLIPE